MSLIDNYSSSIFDQQAKAIDLGKAQLKHISEASEEAYQSYVSSGEKFLQAQYSSISADKANPRNFEYASVSLGGQTVATIDNNGFVQAFDGIGSRIQALFGGEASDLNGPALAEDRAAKIAAMLGGEMEKASTALTQAQYNATPAPRVDIDYEAMQKDPFFQQLEQTKQARTLYMAQQMGQANEASSEISAGEKLWLETSNGYQEVDMATQYEPRQGPVRLEDIPLILPNAQNINTLTNHAQSRFRELMQAYDIPEAPSEISYDGEGNIKLPDDYAYKDELKQALDENENVARELRDLAAITSHYVGMQAAMNGSGIGGYAKISLNFDNAGTLAVHANGEPVNLNINVAETQNAATSYEKASIATESEAEAWFREYMEKSPEERLHDAILKEKGLTPEQLAALPPEQRMAIEREIQQEMKERTENKFSIEEVEATV